MCWITIKDIENIFGMAHGGAIFGLIDEAFETVSNSHGSVAVALNMNITYTAAPSPESGGQGVEPDSSTHSYI